MSQPILLTTHDINIYHSWRSRWAWMLVNNNPVYFYAGYGLFKCQYCSVECLNHEQFENVAPRLIKKFTELYRGQFKIVDGNVFFKEIPTLIMEKE